MKGFWSFSVKIFLGLTVLSLLYCGAKEGDFFYGALGLNEDRILVVNANGTQYGIALYDMDGHLVRVVYDLTSAGIIPRGAAFLDPFRFILATDTPDVLSAVSIYEDSYEDWGVDSRLSGNIYQLARISEGKYIVIEGNTLELFQDGLRFPTSGASPYIGTTVGSCVLSTARGVSLNSAGQLVVTNTGNDYVNVYDISTTTASCVNAYTTLGNIDPVAVLGHSDGNVYVGTQGTDVIYQFDATATTPTSIFANVAIISNPSAVIELPGGNLLIASDGTDSLEEIDTSGNYVGTLVKDNFTTAVTALLFLPAQ